MISNSVSNTMPDDDPRKSTVETANELHNNLEAIAATDLQFAQDEQKYLIIKRNE